METIPGIDFFGAVTLIAEYEDPGINYGELVVARNASRWLKSLIHYGFINQRS